MKKVTKRIFAAFLSVAMLAGLIPQIILPTNAVNATDVLPQNHYGNYETLSMIYDQGGCYSMQGMTVDSQYTYCAKINGSDSSAIIMRTDKSTGAKANMVNSATGTYYFSNLGHANALDIVYVNGANQMFVTAGATLVRLTMSGTTLTTAGTYTASYNGATASMTAVQIMSVSNTEVKVLVKTGRTLYTGTLDPTASSGDIALTKLCTLNLSSARLKGAYYDFSTYTQQGFDFHDNKLFLPLFANTTEEINTSIVLVYDLEGATGTISNDPTLSFRIISGTYAGLFEIEDVAICQQTGRLYFSTNRRKTSSDTNYDSCSYFLNYAYNAAMSTTAPADYRWETVNNELVSVMDGGNTYNLPTMFYGSISDNVMSTALFNLSRSVILKHDVPWVVEWKSSGNFGNGALLLAAGRNSKVVDAPFLFRYKQSSIISFGYYDGSAHQNYGIALSDHGIDGTAEHTYRLTNKPSSDGSNMIYLSVDGTELGPMNNHYIGVSSQGTTSNWVSGQDFTFSYIGSYNHPLSNFRLDYLQVWADGEPDDVADIYRWETLDDNFTAITGDGLTANDATIYNGSISGGVYTSACFRLDEPIVLLHDRPWSVEWKTDSAPSGTFLLSAAEGGKTKYAPFLFRYKDSGMIALGYHDGTAHKNYGLTLSDYGIDGTVEHIYRLTNKVADDGSNMVYLYVDGVEVGAMNNCFNGITPQNTTSDWVNGRDFVFDYVGNRAYSVNAGLEYLQVWENCSHTFGNWSVTNATCTAEGSQTRTCTECGYTETEVINATGHSWTNASCTAAKTCTICGVTEGSMLDHGYESAVTVPTCTTNGFTTHTCTACGDTYTDSVVSATGHNYDAVVTAPTCTEDGYTTHTCSVCGDTYTDSVVGPTGHSYDEGVVTTAPGCTTAGIKTYTCTGCGESFTEYVSATGHNYVPTVTAPTCTENGYTTHTCSVCSDTYTDSAVSASGHSYDEGVVTTDPSCTTAGVKTFTCSCGDSYTEEIAATGHSYQSVVTAPTCTEDGYTTHTCTVCGDIYTDSAVSASGHSYDEGVVTTDPTCTTSGVKTFTCSCGDSYTEAVAALGHSYNAVVTAPTCVAAGYTTHTCGTCGDTYTDSETAATGVHTYVNGTCTGCGAVEVVPTVKMSSVSLALKDEVKFTGYFTIENIDASTATMGLMTFENAPTDVSVDTADHVIPGATYQSSKDRYIGYSQGIPAKEMGDLFYICAYVQLENGTYVYSDVVEYSVEKYAYAMLDYTNDADLQKLLIAMLNYGAEAQLYFGYNTDDLVNADLTDEQKNSLNSYSSDLMDAIVTADSSKTGNFVYTEAAFSTKTVNVTAGGALALNCRFNPAYTMDGDMTLYYWDAATYNNVSELTTANATGSATMTVVNGAYQASVTGIAAKDIDKTIYAVGVYESDGVTYTTGVISYNLNTYFDILPQVRPACQGVCEAAVVYCDYAKLYFLGE